jgi:hypothetical protein
MPNIGRGRCRTSSDTFQRRNDANFLNFLGNDVPKLVISYSYHATYCCGSVVIFEMGKEFKKIAKIKGGSWGVAFSDINGDKQPEAILTDNHYFGWHHSGC